MAAGVQLRAVAVAFGGTGVVPSASVEAAASVDAEAAAAVSLGSVSSGTAASSVRPNARRLLAAAKVLRNPLGELGVGNGRGG